jgi:hypothetical protein
MDTDLVIRVPKGDREGFVALVELEASAAGVTVQRSNTRRSGGDPWAEVLLSLASAGSITAIASVVKTWLDRTRGEIELISNRTGYKVKYKGRIDNTAAQEIAALMAGVRADDRSSTPPDKVKE